MLAVVTDSPWKIVQKFDREEKKESNIKKSNLVNFVPAEGSVPVTSKCKISMKTQMVLLQKN